MADCIMETSFSHRVLLNEIVIPSISESVSFSSTTALARWPYDIQVVRLAILKRSSPPALPRVCNGFAATNPMLAEKKSAKYESIAPANPLIWVSS